MQLSVGGVIVDAVAYEGSMNDTDGNAMEEAGEEMGEAWDETKEAGGQMGEAMDGDENQ